jgi:D-alanyl-D-alanine carboxypeptidase/D-alanyl-D-alanine-endopeptidase (penicillin-binding protein 4)
VSDVTSGRTSTSRRTRTIRTALAAGVAGVVLVAAVLVALGLTVLRGAPGFREFDAFRDDATATGPVRPLAERVPGAVLGVAAPAVLPDLSPDAPGPAAAAIAARLRPLLAAKALGPSVSVDVVDVAGGGHLLATGQTAPRTPASTAKLLTGAAALSVLGAQTTLRTTVVAGTDGVVLVGGGDVLLGPGKGDLRAVRGRAGLGTLAARTASALRAQGRRSVAVRLDDTLFTGPVTARGWSPDDVGNGFVAPVQAIQVDAGRLTDDDYARRAPDPALSAARTFADALTARGIDVRGAVRRGAAPAGADPLAAVTSATVGEQVEYALTESDNTVAEALARLVAVRSGRAGSFAAAGPAVLDQVAALGVPVGGAVLADGSGLADGSRVPPVALTGVLALAAGEDHPELRPLLSGLPVAAVSGTLDERFAERDQRGARGVVRAKTGTLNGVSSLAGTAVDADGRLLVFAVMADRVRSTGSARVALDDVVTRLASCGCR